VPVRATPSEQHHAPWVESLRSWLPNASLVALGVWSDVLLGPEVLVLATLQWP
jgi:hypothetical protein